MTYRRLKTCHTFIFFIAIVGEILGTNLLKLSDGFTKPIPTVSALLSYGVCFYFLSLAMQKIPLGIAYATWSAVGLVFDSLYRSNDFQRNTKCL